MSGVGVTPVGMVGFCTGLLASDNVSEKPAISSSSLVGTGFGLQRRLHGENTCLEIRGVSMDQTQGRPWALDESGATAGSNSLSERNAGLAQGGLNAVFSMKDIHH